MKKLFLTLVAFFAMNQAAQANIVSSCGSIGEISCTEDITPIGEIGQRIDYTVDVGNIGDLELVSFSVDFFYEGDFFFDDFDPFNTGGDFGEGVVVDAIDFDFSVFDGIIDDPEFGDGNKIVTFTAGEGEGIGSNDSGDFFVEFDDIFLASQILAVCQNANGASVACNTPGTPPTRVSEPAGLGLLGLGLIGFAIARRRYAKLD